MTCTPQFCFTNLLKSIRLSQDSQCLRRLRRGFTTLARLSWCSTFPRAPSLASTSPPGTSAKGEIKSFVLRYSSTLSQGFKEDDLGNSTDWMGHFCSYLQTLATCRDNPHKTLRKSGWIALYTEFPIPSFVRFRNVLFWEFPWGVILKRGSPGEPHCGSYKNRHLPGEPRLRITIDF